MFLVWWVRPGARVPEALGASVRAIIDAPGGVCVEQAGAVLGVWPAAHLERGDRGATAWGAKGAGSGLVPQGHPFIRLEDGSVTLAAPPLPEYPAYYVRGPGDQYLLACSRLAPLARVLPEAPLNSQRLAYMLCLGSGGEDPDPSATVYSGIRRLLGAETLVADDRGISIARQIPTLARQYRKGKPLDLATELRHHLDEAIGDLIGDAQRAAVLVSGGLDSSGILALAALRCATTRRELTALSVQFAAPADDRAYFRELVDVLSVTPTVLSARDTGKGLPRSLCVDAQPLNSTGSLMIALNQAAVDHRAGVTLHGGGGDTILGGSLPLAQLARRGHPIAAVTAAVRLRLPWKTTPLGRVRSLVLSPLLPRALLRRRRRRYVQADWMTTRCRALVERCRQAAERSPRTLPDTPDGWMQSLCVDQGQADFADLGGQILDATGNAPSDVFTNLRFVRFMLELDPLLLSHGHEYRGLYRLAMKGVLPERVRRRQDKGRYEPAIAEAVLGANIFDELRNLSSFESLAGRGFVDPARLGSLIGPWFEAVRRGEREESDPADEHWDRVWQLLSVEAFVREHGRGRDLA
jgi:hypothetical protein